MTVYRVPRASDTVIADTDGQVMSYDEADDRWEPRERSLIAGSVSTYDDLPATPTEGQTFVVRDEIALYTWDGADWAGPVPVQGTATEAAVAGVMDSPIVWAGLTRTGARPVGRGELLVSVMDHGAAGDGITDDTAAWQAAVDACPVGGTVTGLGRTYVVSVINLKSDMTLQDARLLSKGSATDFSSPLTIGAYNDTNVRRNITVKRVHIDGRRELHTNIGAQEDGGRHGIRILGRVENLLFEDVTATRCASDGVAIYHGVGLGAYLMMGDGIAKNIRFVRCRFTSNRRHGGSCDSMVGLHFDDCVLTGNGLDVGPSEGEQGDRLGGVLYGNGFDCEEYAADNYAADIHFTRCDMRGNARGSFLALHQAKADVPGWVTRKGFYFTECKLAEGTPATTDGYAVTFTPSAVNKGTGVYYDGIHLVNCEIDGQTQFRSSTNIHHDGGTITSTTAHVGVADLVTGLTVSADRGGKPYFLQDSAVEYHKRAGAETVWVGANQLALISSTPTVGVMERHPVWLFSDAQFDRVGGTVRVPTDWRRVDVTAYWAPAAGASGAVQWICDVSTIAVGSPLAQPAGGAGVTSSSTSGGVVAATGVAARRAVSGGLVAIVLTRDGVNAADTLAGDASLLGLLLTRVE